MTRFIATKRTAIDGKIWWFVWDNMKSEYSNATCFSRYNKKRECEQAILNIPNFYKEMFLREQKTKFYNPNGISYDL